MVMALSLFHRQDDLAIVAAYENGLAVVAQLNSQGRWDITYRALAHTQPILSLDVTPSKDCFITSSADAIIAKHPIPRLTTDPQTQGPPQLAVPPAQPAPGPSSARTEDDDAVQTQPLKVVNTKHSGQQSLRVRSDARVFATAGWDSRARVYSVRTMREVAVLSWHATGCYAAAFSEVEPELPDAPTPTPPAQAGPGGRVLSSPDGESGGGAGVVVPRLVEMTARERRIGQVTTAHWLAVGSKDGKVSLWDVF